MTLAKTKRMFLPYLRQLQIILTEGKKTKYFASCGEMEIELNDYERALIEGEISRIVNVVDVLKQVHRSPEPELIVVGSDHLYLWESEMDFALYFGIKKKELIQNTTINEKNQSVWKN